MHRIDIYKADIESGSLYILLSKFLSLSLMSPRRGSEKKKQMTLGLSGSSDLKVKRYGGGGVLVGEGGGNTKSGKCICVFVMVFLYLYICICLFVFVYLYLCICM